MNEKLRAFVAAIEAGGNLVGRGHAPRIKVGSLGHERRKILEAIPGTITRQRWRRSCQSWTYAEAAELSAADISRAAKWIRLREKIRENLSPPSPVPKRADWEKNREERKALYAGKQWRKVLLEELAAADLCLSDAFAARIAPGYIRRAKKACVCLTFKHAGQDHRLFWNGETFIEQRRAARWLPWDMPVPFRAREAAESFMKKYPKKTGYTLRLRDAHPPPTEARATSVLSFALKHGIIT
ncbi:MAG: hypothetical protein LBC18_14885 [Opitutaceae bacterium]|jgi:hypothetical protein|nr:hypothetical protein [Opitutaceae bacterium]